MQVKSSLGTDSDQEVNIDNFIPGLTFPGRYVKWTLSEGTLCKGYIFDKIIESLRLLSSQNQIGMPTLTDEFKACGWRPFCVVEQSRTKVSHRQCGY